MGLKDKSLCNEERPAGAISFAERFIESDRFRAIFSEGMSLVEATAEYLDGPGRTDARALEGQLSLAYATESMRLTTRLMQISSWLLIRRALNEGEMSWEQARLERRKVKLNAVGRPSHVKCFNELPERLQTLIEASFRLHDKIHKLDHLLERGSGAGAAATSDNPVTVHMDRLKAAFGGPSSG